MFPQLGSPTQFTGLDRVFSDWICAEIDMGLAQYRLWYLGRQEERKKVGKNKWGPKYRTVDELLGVGADDRAGMTSEDFTDITAAYKQAVIANAIKGEPPPDMDEWRAQFEAAREAALDDVE